MLLGLLGLLVELAWEGLLLGLTCAPLLVLELAVGYERRPALKAMGLGMLAFAVALLGAFSAATVRVYSTGLASGGYGPALADVAQQVTGWIDLDPYGYDYFPQGTLPLVLALAIALTLATLVRTRSTVGFIGPALLTQGLIICAGLVRDDPASLRAGLVYPLTGIACVVGGAALGALALSAFAGIDELLGFDQPGVAHARDPSGPDSPVDVGT